MTSAGKPSKSSKVDPLDEGARETVISEEAFLKLLQEPVAQFFQRLTEGGLRDPARWTKRFCSLVTDNANDLEAFLDDVDARNNLRFSYLVELVASIRGFGAITHILHHVRIRFPKYQVRLSVEETEEFQRALREAHAFVNDSLARLLESLREELISLGLTMPDEASSPVVSQESVRLRLPHDMEEEIASSDEVKIAAILSRFMEVADQVKRVERIRPRPEPRELAKFVEEHYDETSARVIESRVHNLQSAYDTHVKSTTLESQDPNLRAFRGHVSLALHLFEVGTLLVHFYERHESVIQHRSTSERIARLIDQGEVIRQAVLFAVVQASRILVHARPIAAELLGRFVQATEIDLTIPEDGMLHARPLSLIVQVVRKHGTAVEMIIDGDSAVANSIMGLILFVGNHPDARKVAFRGDRRPLEDLRLLFEHGLGEQGLDQFPEQLAYLASA
jgi:phosphotransferase system HPr-like phosphotransfer protein